jgi:uroporphyrinogen decarboxylase
MNPADRLRAALTGQEPDRWPFVPSIYEHGAALLGKTPTEVSRDAGLMANAAVAAYRTYQHDLVTVGIDIYNVEAEALGCTVRGHADSPAIPGIASHPLEGTETPDLASIKIPQPGAENRLGLLTEATASVVDRLGDEVWVYGCMAGPFSQAVELRGFNDLIVDSSQNPQSVHDLLERTTELAVEQAQRLSRQGAGVYLYESWATIPLIHPELFATCVVPYNRRVIQAVREQFDTAPPAIIMGGNISVLIAFFLEAESGLVVCDYNADFDLIRRKTQGRNILVRGCVDPKVIERGDWHELEAAIATLARKARGMPNFLWGCGCVSYDTPADHVLRFKDMCLAAQAGA